jgi:RNA polymerase sigma-70 factor (ECF subfamily)
MTDPGESFEPHRRRLRGLAYRMLGSIAEAEDAVQETYLRWHAADRARVSDARAFLMSTTTRICLDLLRSARARRETYVGPWLPEPVIDPSVLAPDTHTELAEDLSIALLLTLDRLSPLERAAFLLHDVFDCPFAEVARALDRSEAACRQLASRARAHVRESQPRVAAHSPGQSDETATTHAQLISAFVHATTSGDLEGLMRLLARDARIVSDGGGKVPAALTVIEGGERMARFLVGTVRKGLAVGVTTRPVTVNGLPGLIVRGADGLIQTVAFEIDGDVVRAIYVVRNPDKLRHLRATGTERETSDPQRGPAQAGS